MVFFRYLGFKKNDEIVVVYPETFEYPDNADLKLEYLKSLEEQEQSRMTTIEMKTSQLIGMTSIIFSLIGLFISNYFSKFSSLSFGLQVLMIAVFSITLLFYLNTIFQASRYLDIKKHPYGQRSANTVKKSYGSSEAFKIEEIKDLLYSIERNTSLTNSKSDYLIYGYRSFKIATIFIGLLSIILLVSGFFYNDQKLNNVLIQGPVSIKGWDSLITNLRPESRTQKIMILHDTFNIANKGSK